KRKTSAIVFRRAGVGPSVGRRLVIGAARRAEREPEDDDRGGCGPHRLERLTRPVRLFDWLEASRGSLGRPQPGRLELVDDLEALGHQPAELVELTRATRDE